MKSAQAKLFYLAVTPFSVTAIGLNFLGFNSIKALVWSGVVQVFSTPFLLLLIMLLSNNPKLIGRWVNSRAMNALGWTTTVLIFAALVGLVVTGSIKIRSPTRYNVACCCVCGFPPKFLYPSESGRDTQREEAALRK